MKSKTILIAYQDDLWARSLSTFFHGIGYRVETARLVSEIKGFFPFLIPGRVPA